MMGSALNPWFDDPGQLEKYCLEPRSREEMRQREVTFRILGSLWMVLLPLLQIVYFYLF